MLAKTLDITPSTLLPSVYKFDGERRKFRLCSILSSLAKHILTEEGIQ